VLEDFLKFRAKLDVKNLHDLHIQALTPSENSNFNMLEAFLLIYLSPKNKLG